MLVVSPMVREMVTEDAVAVARLSGELGYPATPEAMRQRIASLLGSPDHAIFVACLADDVVGWIDVALTCHLASDPRAEIHGLVVSSDVRSCGIGGLLVARGERWALERKLTSMGVRSRDTREAAHRFYLREGYERTKTSAVFAKDLTKGSG